jgi:hypothetical protein
MNPKGVKGVSIPYAQISRAKNEDGIVHTLIYYNFLLTNVIHNLSKINASSLSVDGHRFFFAFGVNQIYR